MGHGEKKEMEYHHISPISGKSKAMMDYAAQARTKEAMKEALSEVKSHNEKAAPSHSSH